MPRSSDLPEQVRNLANMQGTSIDTQRLFHETCERLIQDLSKSSKQKPGKSRFPMIASALAVLCTAGWAYVQFGKPAPIEVTRPANIGKPVEPVPVISSAAPPPVPVVGTPSTRTIALAENLTIELVRIEPGRFLMGNPANTDASSDYKPHEVALTSEFWISIGEITRSQWAVVMAGATPAPAEAQDPKTGVSYSDIVGTGGFLERLNEKTGDAAWKVDLPTEAQWQYASTLSAESKIDPPLIGINGAAAEWCRDWFQASSIGMKDVDPGGPSSGNQRVVRGSPDSRSPRYDRTGQAPLAKNPKTGFRIVQIRADR
jgi:formylglycine-generating enzyme required for sulfatase activity